MRIRTYTAANTKAAIAKVRDEMGPTAVIISIDETANGRGVIVRAAADEQASIEETPTAPPPIEERLEAFLTARLKGPRSAALRAA